MTRRIAAALALTCLAGPLAAQAPEPVGAGSDAAGTITSADIARRIGILAHDSMLGRDTPSRGLELTAKYVADEFRRFGLKPGGDNGTWFQRYPITRRRLHLAQSWVVLKAGSTTATAPLDATARHVSGDIPREPVTGPVVLVGGSVTPEAVAEMNARLAIPPSIRALGYKPGDLDEMAADSHKSWFNHTAPYHPSVEEYRALVERTLG